MTSDVVYPCKTCGYPLRMSVNKWVNQWYCERCDPFFDDTDEDFFERCEEDDDDPT